VEFGALVISLDFESSIGGYATSVRLPNTGARPFPRCSICSPSAVAF